MNTVKRKMGKLLRRVGISTLALILTVLIGILPATSFALAAENEPASPQKQKAGDDKKNATQGDNDNNEDDENE